MFALSSASLEVARDKRFAGATGLEC